jgi:hypothetical protein
MGAVLALVGVVVRDVPVEPEPDEAREWLITELSKPPYQAAQPTLLDRISQAIGEWFSSLTLPDGPPGAGLGVVLALIVGAIIIALLIFGLPRLNRRSRVTGALFGDDDDRDAATMRRDAAAAAARGDHTLAVAEQFRAIARGLAERLVVTTFPGTTAHGFAQQAATVFALEQERLVEAAVVFDAVRYLGAEGTAAQYDELVSLDATLRSLTPAGASA